jgi:hypothetical protein
MATISYSFIDQHIFKSMEISLFNNTIITIFVYVKIKVAIAFVS